MSKATPGPWRIKYGPQHDPEICDITIAGDIFLLADINGPNYAHCEANARLIAASPTMFDYIKRQAEAGDTEARAILEAIHAAR